MQGIRLMMSFICLLASVLLLSFLCNTFLTDIFIKNTPLQTIQNQTILSQRLPLILEWNVALWASKPKNDKFCPYYCTYTTNRSLLGDAEIAIYHMGAPGCFAIPGFKDKPKLNAFLNLESPSSRPFFKYLPANFFDLTITYRQDSDIPVYYDRLVKLDDINDNDQWKDTEIEATLNKKNSPVLWLVSHCNTSSMREIYINDFKKYLNVTQMGECNNASCTPDCENQLIQTHYFYLAFENSVCVDYITEKYFRMRKLIVPIVMDKRVFRGMYENLLNYTIFASDYESPKHLADYLKYLLSHREEYMKYFAWTKYYKKTSEKIMPPDVWCQLCTISHQVRNGTFQKKMVDIRAWWDQNTCYSAVGRELVYKKKQVPNNELDATLIKHIQHPYVKSIVDSIGFHNHTAAKDVLQNHYQWLSKFLDPEMQMEMCNIVEEIDRTIQVIS